MRKGRTISPQVEKRESRQKKGKDSITPPDPQDEYAFVTTVNIKRGKKKGGTLVTKAEARRTTTQRGEGNGSPTPRDYKN